MDLKINTTHKLLQISGIALILLTLRVYLHQHFIYTFLIWNLFLAYLPLAFAQQVKKYRGRPLLFWACLSLWLLFWPNAPYLVTDLVHLHRSSSTFWLDLSMFSSFAILGCVFGYLSFRIIQAEFKTLYPKLAELLLPLIAIPLAAFGIYLGRVVRLNSWDMVLNPIGTIQVILKSTVFSEDRMFFLVFVFSISLFLYLLHAVFGLLSKSQYLHK